MQLSERKKKILKAVVDEYINTAEPVGSKAIAANSGLGISSATIRNEMAELTSLGYLEQPHTSAGRIPSAKGYRLYVDELMHRHRLTVEEAEDINHALNVRLDELDRLLAESGRAISQMTNYPTFVMAAHAARTVVQRFDFIFIDETSFIAVVMVDKNTIRNKLIRVAAPVDNAWLQKLSAVMNTNLAGLGREGMTPNVIAACEQAVDDSGGAVASVVAFALEVLGEADDSGAYFAGTSKLLEHPEFRDVDKAQKMLTVMSPESHALRSLTQPAENGMQIIIGPENLAEELRDTSVVVAKYDVGDNMQGIIGVVGPTRMDYAKITAKLGYFAETMTRLFNGEQRPVQQIAQSSLAKEAYILDGEEE